MKPNIIYLRTSTEEQNPENQLKDCIATANRLGLTDYEPLQDKQSGWKDKEREFFDALYIAVEKNQIRNIICWDLDRLYRNRLKLKAFFELCKIKNCKIYSVRQEWLESLNKMPPPFDDIVHSLMLNIMGWLAEEESSKKSERVKIAVRRESGITKSYNGKKWGRRPIDQKFITSIFD